ncbi:hypothetical protein PoB_003987400 [Plakobranchus ocellatus]|uniref:Uncharacterized protein n=1 Tax=Plakobranchus ocellatus TaxID=259542 RepID=A0AAV4B035_9GAST|nr:hypothetical protein PoB_003987400 [Plakobranchus ocellatus]
MGSKRLAKLKCQRAERQELRYSIDKQNENLCGRGRLSDYSTVHMITSVQILHARPVINEQTITAITEGRAIAFAITDLVSGVISGNIPEVDDKFLYPPTNKDADGPDRRDDESDRRANKTTIQYRESIMESHGILYGEATGQT